MDTPAVSIIMPVYNAEAYLDASVGSVCAQTCGDWELVCFNDASTDSSPQMLHEFAGRDSRIRVIDSPVNVRQGEGRNRAISAAVGEYIMFLDADDMLAPEAIMQCLAAARSDDADMVLFDYRQFADGLPPESGAVISPLGLDAANLHGDEMRLRIIERPTPVWSAMYRRSLWTDNSLRFPAGIFYEDNAVALAAQLSATRPVKIPAALLFYRVVHGSVSHRRNDYRFFHRLSSARTLKDTLVRLDLYNETFRTAIDWVLLRQYLIHSVYGCIYRFDKVPRLRHHYICSTIDRLVPDYRDNRYYRQLSLRERVKLWTHMRYPRLLNRLHRLKNRI
ncbi:MAG: glycosyltransferase [Duncaniella sp.]|nr:glycosyltransferase [Duncaniella sp.]